MTTFDPDAQESIARLTTPHTNGQLPDFDVFRAAAEATTDTVRRLAADAATTDAPQVADD